MKRAAALLVLFAISLRLAVMAGADDKAEGLLKTITADGRLIAASLSLEFGTPMPEEYEKADETSSVDYETEEVPVSVKADEKKPDLEHAKETEEAALPQNDTVCLPENQEIVPTTITGGMNIINDTSFEPDIAALMNEDMNLRLPMDGYQILIIHTHGSEAYTPDAMDYYEPTDPGRTEDKSFNVIRVGDELASALEAKGLKVLHDRGIYDYPSYMGSYNSSMEAIEGHLSENPEIALVIDLHRDALGSDNVVYKTMAQVGGEPASQLMMLIGTGENGLYHPSWRENLKLALHLQSELVGKYPTLARPISLKKERYNQHLTTGSLILEVGSSGNTLREALCAVKLYADGISDYLLSLRDIPIPND